MILLCGGEGAAGVQTCGAFFLLVSFRGRRRRGGHSRLEAAAAERAARALPVEIGGLERRRGRIAWQERPALRLV